jgi:RNA polymerase sigma-70 factor (ECF subfamily)
MTAASDTLRTVEPGSTFQTGASAAPYEPGDDEATWLVPLREAAGAAHDAAVLELHALLLRAAGHEVHRRMRAMQLDLGDEAQILVEQSADDALVAVLGRLDSFEGRSRFTTWAFKFAIHTAGVAVRHAAWRARTMPTVEDGVATLRASADDPHVATHHAELLRATSAAIATISPRQREVLVALAINGVPIDVLADRMSTTRGALYKALHDARNAVRRRLVQDGVLDHDNCEVLDD